MFDLLPHRLPWWLAGPGVGLCVVALYVLGNMRLGVSGSWLQALAVVRRQRPTEPWRLWFLAGLVGGVLVAAGLGTVHLHGYGALGSEVAPWMRKWRRCRCSDRRSANATRRATPNNQLDSDPSTCNVAAFRARTRNVA